MARRWQRLRRATLDELRVRSIQAINKRLDYIGSFLPPNVSGDSLPTGCRGNFFFGQPSPVVASIRERLPDEVEATIARAERVLAGAYDLLGYHNLNFGTPINWHLDPVSGKQAPRHLPWYRIDFLDYDRVGDAKVIWELNRHQHLVLLVKAYHFTRDGRLIDEAMAQFESWQQQNPYPFGINWASSLEVAIRALSWLWTYHLLQHVSDLRLANFLPRLHAAVCLSARHIQRYLSTYFSPNTHLLGEGVALYFAGTLCDDKDSQLWRKQGRRIVLQEAERQVQADGFHFEQSTYYHVYALDFFLHFWLLAQVNNDPISDKFVSTVESMADALCALTGDAKAPPRFGDDDGGRLFDSHRNRPEHLTDPLSTAAVVFGKANYKSSQANLTEETVWLCGSGAVAKYDSIARQTDFHPYVTLPCSGFRIMADPTMRARMVIDAGPQGSYGGGHSHADALSLQVSVNGLDVLGDPGTYVYVGNKGERQLFRGTGVHNTLQLASLDQMKAAGPFPWQSCAEVRVSHDISAGNRFALLAAEHNGFEASIMGAVHRRTIFHSAGEFWLVHDSVGGCSRQQVRTHWVLAPTFVWECEDRAALVRGDGFHLSLLAASSAEIKLASVLQHYSLVYGDRVSASALEICSKATLPIDSAIVLRIVDNPSESEGALRRHSSSQHGCAAYCYVTQGASHLIFVGVGQSSWQAGEIESDAAFVCCTFASVGLVRLLIFDATYFRAGGLEIFRATLLVPFWEIKGQVGSEHLECEIPDFLCCSPTGLTSTLVNCLSADLAPIF